ncbi:TIGR02680 family protein [Euzebya sp.]|uniref:TIGR02680 family protein n=1 Tax=Euzebya sp. TaxID=1971409 RepID=UPI003514C576
MTDLHAAPPPPSPSTADPALPRPTARRWTPLRLGLVDLFHYGTEEFAFHDGRLLLRGNNGTGKSKVLALTLPYLLDGDASAQRVEPDRDPGKRMEWNLLLGGRHTDRLGYAWIEFGRVDEDGQAHTTTLCCGMKAVQGRGIAKKWFAITSLRMGEGLHLVDATGLALSQPRLRDLLGADGRIVEGVEQWRRTVDEALFGLGSARYDAMISLLIQLRQPQLSRRPDEAALDAALTEALPPLDQAVIAAVADAMRNLEDDRQALTDLAETRQTLERFADVYRRYARTALHRREAAVRSQQSTWERASVALRDARTALEEAEATRAQIAADRQDAERQRRELEVAQATIERSAAMQDAVRLDDARTAADRAAAAVELAARNLDAAADRLATRRRARDEQAATLADAAGRAVTAGDRAALLADPVGLGEPVATHVGPVVARLTALAEGEGEGRRLADSFDRSGRGSHGSDGSVGVIDVDGAAAEVDAAVRRRRDVVAEVRRLAQEVVTAKEHADRREEDRDRAGRERSAAAEALNDARDVLAERGEALVAATEEWVAGLTEVALDDPVGLLDALSAWVEEPTGADPFAGPVDTAGRSAAATLAERGLEIRQARADVEAQRQDAVDEQTRLRAGVDPTPAPSPARDVDGRDGRPGAPLWRLVNFQDWVPADQRAGVEAALEGAGLLDAWVTPDGGLADPAWRDAGLVPLDGEPDGGSLADVLDGVADQPVGVDAVRRLLAGIGWGAATANTWVAADGRYHIGVVEGAWTKPEAVHIGAAARQAARAARIAELDAVVADLDDQLATLDAAAERLVARQTRLDAELASRPEADGVRQAGDRLGAAAVVVERAEAAFREAQDLLDEAVGAVRDAELACGTTAVPLGLPVTVDQLDRIARGIDELAVHLGSTTWPACRDAVAAARRLSAEVVAVADAEDDLAGQQAEHDRAAREHSELDAEARQLAALVGATVEQAQQELADAKARLRTVRARLEELGEAASTAAGEVGRLEGRIEGLEADRDGQRAERDAAVESLRRAVDRGVLAAALPDVEPPPSWAADPAVRWARQLRDDLADVDGSDDAWNGVQGSIARAVTQLQSDLSVHGGRAEQDLADDLLVVSVTYWQRTGAAHELAGVLQAEIDERELLLSAQERELIENHLIDEAGAQLGERIRDAEARVQAMNAQLEACATSTGMTLRLRWVPAPAAPTSLRSALDVLRQTHQLWGAEQRAVLGELLESEIQRARETDEHGTWTDHLARALDYRRWFSFVVERGGPDGWRRASGPASGGERVLAATLPLFAAAASHYSSARPEAPRLVLLDEAFAGVDDRARRSCMGLLTAFDLDCVLTSEREWGCYPEVPGLSICHLVRREGIDAVLVSRWRWDGTARERVEGVDTARQVAPPSPADEEADDGSLFA